MTNIELIVQNGSHRFVHEYDAPFIVDKEELNRLIDETVAIVKTAIEA